MNPDCTPTNVALYTNSTSATATPSPVSINRAHDLPRFDSGKVPDLVIRTKE